MSPEYALDGFFSEKSDVFSFGVMVLEIIGGRRNTGFYQSDQTLSLLGQLRTLNLSFILMSQSFSMIYNTILILNFFLSNCHRHGSYGKKTGCWS